MKLFSIPTPFVFTIFGASGDLAKVKIFPALYSLAEQKRFPKEFFIFGYSRTAKDDKTFREEISKSIRQAPSVDEKVLNELLGHCFYFTGQYDQETDFQKFSHQVLEKTQQKQFENIHYLAVPPTAFAPIIQHLAHIREVLGNPMKLIIEKPFGSDEKSARSLFHHVSTFFDPENIFLLDHYLGKEAVQTLLVLRYANSILNTLLSGHLIANIQITAFEDIGVENRISYFDQVGIIKDMVQSHLLQLLSLLLMQLPVEQESDSIHREKFSILSALKLRGQKNSLVLGQHKSYLSLPGVKKDSPSPTFAALRLFLDQQEWYQVPIYIRTGKMLKKKHTYVVVEFKKHPFQTNLPDIETNKLILELQPQERLHLKLFTKIGGSQSQFHDLTTSESLACFGDDCLPEHGRLLLNVFQNDHRHFLDFEEIIASWKFTDMLLQFSNTEQIPVIPYEDFSDGPKQQYDIPKQDGFEWYDA